MSISLKTRQNLFRYASEWDPKKHAQTKGGYIEGEIELPAYDTQLRMTIETFPTDNVPELIEDVHPLILHLVKMGKGRREQDKEPVPNCHHWKLDFLIENDSVFIENKISDLDFNDDGSKRNIPSRDLVTQVQDNKITLNGKRGNLNLVILTPKQDARAKNANSGEATVGTVLADRVKFKNNKTINEMSKIFKNAYYMKKVNLKVKFFTPLKGDWKKICSSISPNSIRDIGNKVIGALELHDVTPLKSCAVGGRKVAMISEYDLAENTVPIFQVWDNEGFRRMDLDHLLVQPTHNQTSDTRTLSVRKTSIIFLTPAQPNLHRLANMKIKLTLLREGDGQLANNAFDFKYIKHIQHCCLFCYENIDSEAPTSLSEPMAKARPGFKKKLIRTFTDEFSNTRRLVALLPDVLPAKRSRVSTSLSDDSRTSIEEVSSPPPKAWTPPPTPWTHSPEELFAASPAYGQCFSTCSEATDEPEAKMCLETLDPEELWNCLNGSDSLLNSHEKANLEVFSPDFLGPDLQEITRLF